MFSYKTLFVLLACLVQFELKVSALSTTTPPTHNSGGSGNSPNTDAPPSQDSNNFQATWEDVGRNLVMMRNAGVPNEILMTTRLAIPNLCRTEVRESLLPNAGRGLFATMDAKKGDLLTCYPGDVLLERSGMTNLPEDIQKDKRRLQMLLASYCIGVTDKHAIMGLPEKADDVAYCGHIINDGVVNPPVRKSELQKYISESNKIANVEHSPLEHCHMVTRATRDIQAGEELYVFYGPTYWMDHIETWIGDDEKNDKANFSLLTP